MSTFDGLLTYLFHGPCDDNSGLYEWIKIRKEADAVAVFPNETILAYAFIFTAELVEILIAVLYMIRSSGVAFVNPDSKSALQALKVTYTSNPLVVAMQQHLYVLHVYRKRFLPTSELKVMRADVAANIALTYLPSFIKHRLIPDRDYAAALRYHFGARWQDQWRNETKRSTSRQIKPIKRRWPTARQRNRMYEFCQG